MSDPAHPAAPLERRFLAAAHARRFAVAGFLHEIGSGRAGRGGRGAVLRPALVPVALAYGALSALRARAGHAARVRLDRPVLCVGALALGGSGKTPFVRWLGGRLAEAGRSPAVLTRGYGWLGRGAAPMALVPGDLRGADPATAAGSSGRNGPLPDEACLFLRDGLAVGAHPRRARAAAALARAGVHPGAYLLDDGFQHRQLHRDWDLVLVSRRELAAPRRPLPAGPFRELWQALARADRIAITGLDREEARSFAGRSHAELGLPAGEPPLLAGLEWDGMLELGAWHGQRSASTAGEAERAIDPGADLEGCAEPLLAFSGIADPLSFERLLASRGLPVAMHVVFPDHHRYTARELARLLEMRPPGGTLVTTEKDAARLRPGCLPPGTCRVAAVHLVLWRGEDDLRADLRRLVAARA